MSSFPSKWFEFTNHKELRRLRRDINNTLSLKLQIASSVIIAIISFFMTEYIKECSMWVQVIFCTALCILVALVFVLPSAISYWKLKRRCNVLIKGKDAVNIFDDEIVYSVLVACEYYSARKSIPDSELKNDIELFYDIEIKYYISESIKRLKEFSANSPAIFGDGKNKISKERANNIVNMIDILIEKANIQLDKALQEDFKIFCECIK